ncbi:unnamed protein product [Echinostoma caproni]|uniref:Dol-P-Glc:Glc(2)Man(9)GlcNAc(2)-PP-Dol alpha-1,2-glucosyltransferase n=1 Tax=Echinostoma caproni TaxID=27848 RepID=A0A183B167_9TREM|nr:unnamed protein product [Echinostoma caproni]
MKQHRDHSWIYFCVSLFSVVVTFGASMFLASAFSRVQPEPYMDEIFHVRQTQLYLQGNWTHWDKKITTPPGTYVLFVAAQHLLKRVNLLINRRLCGTQNPIKIALSIITNPVLFFFSALYYTDQCALIALFGAYGIFVRQTNVVWLLVSLSTQPKLPWRAFFNAVLGAPVHFAVVLGFILFVYWNEGIVLGDKTAHQAVIHVCQLWYFFVFCTLLTPWQAFQFALRYLVHSLLLSLCALAIILVSLRYTSFVHPYLLADNRHYTFYVWRKIISRTPVTFYSLSVVYLYFTMTHCLINTALILGTLISLVPAGLLEPRYFILPYTLWRLFAVRFLSGQTSVWFLEFGMNVCVIGITSYLFYAKPFFWSHEPGVQRFIW